MYMKYDQYTLAHGLQKVKTKTAIIISSAALVFASGLGLSLAFFGPAQAAPNSNKGFDEFGYNYSARVFNGPADGIDKSLDGKVWGDPAYAQDHLTMKWNKAWDDCNDHGNFDPTYCAGAWENNQWNGAVPGGSGEVWHYKIVWIGDYTTDPSLVPEGAQPLWNAYAIIADHGVADNLHTFLSKAEPNGYGAYKK